VSEASRFWAKVVQVGDCWLWQAHAKRGYGRFRSNGRMVVAHRWAYEQLRVEVPPGLELDHLCRNPSCVNPWHLEPVTHAVNVSRAARASCAQGHPFDASNTYTWRGRRNCRVCNRESQRRARSTTRAEGVPA
jgi:hypothetical protein